MTQKEYYKILKSINSKNYLIGQNVLILKSRKTKLREYEKTIGLIGTIRYIGGEYGVEIEGLKNPLSDKGLFYYNHLEFEFVDKERKEREVKEMEVKGNYRVATCKFLQGTNTTKGYAFALFDDSIKLDDCVLCDTANGYGVARIVNIEAQEEYVGKSVTKEIICKVDFTDFNNRIETRKKKDAIKKTMDKMVKENQEVVLYKMLAESNPDMAKLLEEYQSLSNV